MAHLSLRNSLSRETLLTVAVASFGLMTPALISGFVLVFPDTADYIILTPRMYRSPFYQAWVFATGWKVSMWSTVFFQSVVISWLLVVFLKLQSGASTKGVAVSLACLCVLSSLPVSISYIMPDVFTGAMFVIIYVLVFKWKEMDTLLRVFIAISACFAISVHLSHLTLAIGMAMACVVYLLLSRPHDFAKGGLVTLVVTCGVSAACIVAYNAVVFRRITLNPAGSTFLMANMIAEGPARTEITEACPAARYRICKYSGRLPKGADTFLWDSGMLVHLGGFEGMADESSRVVRATLMHHPLAVARASISNTFAALHTFNPSFEIEPNAPFVDKTIRLVYGSSVRDSYKHSKQEHGSYPRQLITMLTYVGMALSFSITGYLGWTRRGRGLTFFWYVCAAFVGDTFVCATLSGVHDRYQSRVTWLFMLAALALVIDQRRGNVPLKPPSA